MRHPFAIAGWWLASALFLAITAYYIVFHHVSPLSRDQWHMLHALVEQGLWRTSTTTVSGHRHLLAFLLYDIDLHHFGGKNHFLIAVDWLLNLAFIAIIVTQVRSCLPRSQSRTLLVGWVILLLCWLLNIALLGWGFNGINNYLSIVNSLLAVVVLHRAVHEPMHRVRDTALAFALAGLATFSFGNGILVWPVCLLSLWLWRAPSPFMATFAGGALLFLLLYLLLPGGSAVGATLQFNGWHIVQFPLEVAGGPLYHLLRSWRVLPEAALQGLMTGFGLLVTAVASGLLWQRLRQRPPADRLDALAVALVLTGYGTSVMLALTRVEGVLDPAVDRFQVWGLLAWLGVALLLFRRAAPAAARRWCALFLLFPLLALPSQLDWGARLAEYRTRVDNALLAYRVYLPVAEDAERALHWNWQNKLVHLFPMLDYLREHQLNIYADGAVSYLGKPVPSLAGLPACHWALLGQQPVRAADLLDVRSIAGTEAWQLPLGSPQQVVGWRWQADVQEPGWDAGLLVDGDGIVRGLLQPVRHSLLPRASGLLRDSDNAYGVARMAAEPAGLVLLRRGELLCGGVEH